MKFSIPYIIIVLSFLGSSAAYSAADEFKPELPDGTTFAIKDDFWLYESQRRFPYRRKMHHAMSPSVKMGMSVFQYKYIKTIPAGTRFEVVSSKQSWTPLKLTYIVKPVSNTLPELGSSLIELSLESMIEELYGKIGAWKENQYQYLRLDMSLFTDFTYPDKE